MKEQKTRPILFILLLFVALIFAVSGGFALSKDDSSILGYLMLGLGLGGVIAGVGEFISSRSEKKSKH